MSLLQILPFLPVACYLFALVLTLPTAPGSRQLASKLIGVSGATILFFGVLSLLSRCAGCSLAALGLAVLFFLNLIVFFVNRRSSRLVRAGTLLTAALVYLVALRLLAVLSSG